MVSEQQMQLLAIKAINKNYPKISQLEQCARKDDAGDCGAPKAIGIRR